MCVWAYACMCLTVFYVKLYKEYKKCLYVIIVCVSLCCIYIFLFSLYISPHISPSLYIYISLPLSISLVLSPSPSLSTYIFLYISLFSLCVSALCAHARICLSIWVHVYVYVRLHACLSLYLCMCKCVWIHHNTYYNDFYRASVFVSSLSLSSFSSIFSFMAASYFKVSSSYLASYCLCSDFSLSISKLSFRFSY